MQADGKATRGTEIFGVRIGAGDFACLQHGTGQQRYLLALRSFLGAVDGCRLYWSSAGIG